MAANPIDLDLTDPAFITNPYPVYNWLRTTHPVFFSKRYQAWFLSQHQDIKAVFANESQFGFTSAFKGPQNLQPTWSETTAAAHGIEGYMSIRQKVVESQGLWIASRDTADHNRLRKEFNPPFLAGTLKVGEPDITALVHSILDTLEAKQEIDIINDFGIPLTTRVFLNLLGVDYSNSDWILKQSLHLSKLFFLDVTARDKELGFTALTTFMEFFKNRIRENGAMDDGGLISMLLKGQCLGRISMDEVLANLSFFILAGVQSTIHFIGNIFYCLMQNPDQLDALKADHSLAEKLNEEVLRLETVNAFSSRSAHEDIEIAGNLIMKGQKIILLNGSANRDENVFNDSSQFIADRYPNPHLAFGFATRYCIGAYLSRQEAKIALQVMLARFPQFSIDSRQELNWFYNFRIRGLKHLRLKLHE
jgi:cytochrome P450